MSIHAADVKLVETTQRRASLSVVALALARSASCPKRAANGVSFADSSMRTSAMVGGLVGGLAAKGHRLDAGPRRRCLVDEVLNFFELVDELVDVDRLKDLVRGSPVPRNPP